MKYKSHEQKYVKELLLYSTKNNENFENNMFSISSNVHVDFRKSFYSFSFSQ